jgi:hypothetical protein
MATLVTRPGDPQALKGAAAAAAAEVPLTVLPLAESGAWKKLLADSSRNEASSQLFLVLPDGSALADANAIARYLGGLGAAGFPEGKDVACKQAVVSLERSAQYRPADAARLSYAPVPSGQGRDALVPVAC